MADSSATPSTSQSLPATNAAHVDAVANTGAGTNPVKAGPGDIPKTEAEATEKAKGSGGGLTDKAKGAMESVAGKSGGDGLKMPEN